jgi:Spy/CpxP family protein refolding chaperone
MTRPLISRRWMGLLTTLALVLAVSAWPHAQRGGRGGGGLPGGGEGGYQYSRLEILANGFALTKDQKKTVKDLLDAAHKAAAPTREALASSHAAIGAAIAANKGQAEIDAAVKQYGQQAAAMTELEMKALADVLTHLEAEQRTNGTAIRTAFFLMRGIFLDEKKWDAVPDSRSY